MPETISLPLCGVLAAIVDFLSTQTTNDTSWIAGHNRVWRHIIRDHRTCTDDRSFTNRHSWQYTHIKSKPSRTANPDWLRWHLRLKAPRMTVYSAFEFASARKRV